MAIMPAKVPGPSQDHPDQEETRDWKIFVAFTMPHFGNLRTATHAVGNLLADIRNQQGPAHLEDWWMIPHVREVTSESSGTTETSTSTPEGKNGTGN